MSDKLTLEDISFMLGEIPEHKKQAIDDKISSCICRLQSKLDFDITAPVVLFDLEGHVGGQAIGGRTIRLNRELIFNDDTWPELLNRIVPHELAHIVQRRIYPRSKPHGAEWQYIMSLLGLPADRTHNLKTTPKKVHRKYTVYCDCGEKQLGATRYRRMFVEKTSKYTCTVCGQRCRLEA